MIDEVKRFSTPAKRSEPAGGVPAAIALLASQKRSPARAGHSHVRQDHVGAEHGGELQPCSLVAGLTDDPYVAIVVVPSGTAQIAKAVVCEMRAIRADRVRGAFTAKYRAETRAALDACRSRTGSSI
jgi:hypothetical protein